MLFWKIKIFVCYMCDCFLYILALDNLPSIKIKSRAYSEKNLYHPQVKTGYIQSTKGKGNRRILPNSSKVGAFRSTPNVAHSTDPEVNVESYDLVNCTSETRDADRHTPIGMIALPHCDRHTLSTYMYTIHYTHTLPSPHLMETRLRK